MTDLKKEIELTCIFFAEGDIKMYGKITASTVEIFAVQNVAIPENLKKYLP